MQSTPRSRRRAAPIGALEIYGMPGHLIRRMHQASQAIFEAEISKAGIDLTPVQFAALTAINAHPGLDQATLASAIAYDRVTIGGVIDRLESKGLVRRDIDRSDRRSRRLHLEPRGEVVLEAATQTVREAQKKILKGLNAAETATLMRLLRKSLEAVGEEARAPLRPLAGEPVNS